MNHELAKEFNSKSLIKFVFPTIIMMLFLSSYTSIDGAFVSKLINEDALAAVNIVYPYINVVYGIGLMLATGSTAIISKYLGAKNNEKARDFFSFTYLIGILSGLIITTFTFIFKKELLTFLGANDALYDYALEYMLYLMPFATVNILQMFSQYFFVTEGKTTLSLIVSLIGGISNIVLDYLFMGPLNLGIKGAAIATGIGFCIPGLYSIYYFIKNKNGMLYFVKPHFDSKNLFHTFVNGSSELINNLALGVSTLLFNVIMMDLLGNKGVSAITVILYVQFIQAAVYFGYIQGVSPIISYKYGAKDHKQLHFLIKTSMLLIIFFSMIIIIGSICFNHQAVGLFLHKTSEVYDLTRHGFIIVTVSFIFMGINLFTSALFTAFGNGKISALLSFFRTLVFIVGALLILPHIMGVDGVWWAIPLAEGLAFIMSLYFYLKGKKLYNY